MFKEERTELQFQWSDLGDIREGRPNLGQTTDVAVYRLMQFTLRDVLVRRLGPEAASEIFREAGRSAGLHFCRNVLNTDQEFNEFVAQLQAVLKDLGVGVLRVEFADLVTLQMTLAVYEDLDCSGLPISDETVCDYDEGFIAGVLEGYTGRAFEAREVDCWSTGARVCRFDVKLA